MNLAKQPDAGVHVYDFLYMEFPNGQNKSMLIEAPVLVIFWGAVNRERARGGLLGAGEVPHGTWQGYPIVHVRRSASRHTQDLCTGLYVSYTAIYI